jgi:uncharacterized membrane protein YfcA
MFVQKKSVSKIAFLFVAYVVISGGVLSKSLSCQLQKSLETNIYSQHVIGLLLIYVFIMLEGGWDFSEEENNKAERDWSSGNSIHSFFYSIGIYILFLLSSKMRFWQNVLFLFALLFLYMVNTQTTYWKNRDRISEEEVEKSSFVQKMLIGLTGLLFIYGISDYYVYQNKQHGKNFSIIKFLAGTPKCNYEKR